MAESESGQRSQSPYIFVSYSHEDDQSVMTEVSRAQELDIDIWYDDGIHAGSDWREEIAERIHACRLFIFFLSPRSIRSPHCLREVNYALECEKPILVIHLEQTELTKGLQMSLASRQAIMKFELSEADYLAKLRSGVEAVMGEIPALAAAEEQASARKRSLMLPALGIVAMAAALVLWFVMDPAGSLDPVVSEELAPDPDAVEQVEFVTSDLEPAIAVLPFVNMSSDPDNEYFSDGISEEILNALVRTGTIDVIARTSSFQFKGRNVSTQKMAQELKVSHILEGSVRKFGNDVRITAQLVNALTGKHLWSQSYDRELTNVFQLQGEIAAGIVQEISNAMGGIEDWDLAALERRFELPDAQGVHPDAYEHYLRAISEIANSSNVEEFFAAISMLETVVEIDPEFTQPWFQIGLFQLANGIRPLKESAEIARPAIERALKLDPNHPGALALMGTIQAFVDYRWKEGEVMIRRAVELAPSDPHVRNRLGTLLSMTNRRVEGLKEHEKAYQLDPLNINEVYPYVERLRWSGRMEDAENIAETVGSYVENSFAAPSMVSLYLSLNRPEKAKPFLDILRHQFGDDSSRYKVAAKVYADLTGDTQTAARLEQELIDRFDTGEFVPYHGWTDKRLMERMERFIEDRDYSAPWVLLAFATSSEFDRYREEMRLGDFEVRAIHLASDLEKAEMEVMRIPLTREQLDSYSGLYIQKESGWVHDFYRENDKLMFHVPGDSYRGEAIPYGKNKFINGCCVLWRYRFARNEDTGLYTVVVLEQQIETPAHLQTFHPEPKILERFQGKFTSEDGKTIVLKAAEGTLQMTGDFGELELHAVDDNGRFLVPMRAAEVNFGGSESSFTLRLDDQVQTLSRI